MQEELFYLCMQTNTVGNNNGLMLVVMIINIHS